MLGLGFDQHSLHFDRRAQPQRQAAVVVMMIRKCGELLAADEPARRAVTELLGGVIECKACSSSFRDRSVGVHGS
jgi:hypothetical protein